MSWHRLRRAAARYGLKGLLVRAPARVGAIAHAVLTRRLDAIRGTYADVALENPRKLLPNDFDWTDPSQREAVLSLAALYEAHRFDVLGSGWLRVGYSGESAGFEGHRYHMPPKLEGGWPTGARWPARTRREVARIRALIPPMYEPIDWHRDPKSGFRWQLDLHVTQSATAPAPGVDVKMPWELARMQHLPILAHAYALDVEQDASQADRHLRELESQILDFISSNPPRLGVNWQCTMDVGIRVANWVMAIELLRVRGAQFRNGFVPTFVRSVYEHARHIVEHFEFSESYRDNHYLANIAGLVFAAAYLPAGPESDAWLAFGAQELAVEVMRQFHEDGSGSEGSITYHALSLDIVLWAAWLLEILSPTYRESFLRYEDVASSVPRSQPLRAVDVDTTRSPRLPAAVWERLGRAVQFMRDVTRPDGTLPQIGDDDSGRFLRISPAIQELEPARARAIYPQLSSDAVSGIDVYLDEKPLDRQRLTAFGAILTGQRQHLRATQFDAPESRLAALRMVEPTAPSTRPRVLDVTTELNAHSERLRVLWGSSFVSRFEIAHPPGWRDDLAFVAYPGMGVYVWRSSRAFLLIRCGEVGQWGRGGHAHNDQLGIELIIDEVERVVDPGTYVYTADPDLRNRYRSVQVHFVPALAGGGQNLFLSNVADLFRMVNGVAGLVHAAGPQGFAGEFSARGESASRVVRLVEDAVVVEDFSAHEPAKPRLARTQGYGRRARE